MAHDNGGLRFAGSGLNWPSFLQAFGKDVVFLASEPYCAGASAFNDFVASCGRLVENRGVASDLCGYMKTYLGSLWSDRYILPNGQILPWPHPDLYVTGHICCSHAKWYQYAAELCSKPMFGIDWGCRTSIETDDSSLDYLLVQALECIDWIEKQSGRKFDDDLFIENALREMKANELWSEICFLNQSIPAPISENSLYSFFSFNLTNPQWEATIELFRQLKDETIDRVKRGIAGVAEERYRIATSASPQWAFLKDFRALERKFGAIPVISQYVMQWGTAWEFDGECFHTVTAPTRAEFSAGGRADWLRRYIDWRTSKNHSMQIWSSGEMHSKLLVAMVKQWKCDAVVLMLNRGCEGTQLGMMENRSVMLDAGYPVLAYETFTGDNRNFDAPRVLELTASFYRNLQSLGSRH